MGFASNTTLLDFKHSSPEDSSGAVSYARHDVYYLDTITLVVEDWIFKVPLRLFENGSPSFISKRPAGSGSESRPIILNDVKRVDFECLLRVMYPMNLRPAFLTLTEWISVLRLSTRWKLHDTREIAKEAIGTFEINPVQRILLSQEFEVLDWFLPACQELAARSEVLTKDEGKLIGLDAALEIMHLRERSGPCRCPGYVRRQNEVDEDCRVLCAVDRSTEDQSCENVSDETNAGTKPEEKAALIHKEALILLTGGHNIGHEQEEDATAGKSGQSRTPVQVVDPRISIWLRAKDGESRRVVAEAGCLEQCARAEEAQQLTTETRSTAKKAAYAFDDDAIAFQQAPKANTVASTQHSAADSSTSNPPTVVVEPTPPSQQTAHDLMAVIARNKARAAIIAADRAVKTALALREGLEASLQMSSNNIARINALIAGAQQIIDKAGAETNVLQKPEMGASRRTALTSLRVLQVRLKFVSAAQKTAEANAYAARDQVRKAEEARNAEKAKLKELTSA